MSAVPVLDAASAVAVAAEQAAMLAKGASARDAERLLPHEEIAALKASGLLAITVPAEHGGAGLPVTTVAEVFRLLAAGDPNVAQIPHSHFVYVNALRHQGTAAQQARLFGEVLARRLLRQRPVRARHQARARLPHHADRRPEGGGWRLDGVKGYCTGALFADWIPVLAHLRRGRPDARGLGRRGTPTGVEVDRRLERPGPAHHGQRHRPAAAASRCPRSWITASR